MRFLDVLAKLESADVCQRIRACIFCIAIAVSSNAYAALVDLAKAPLDVATTADIRPNLMLVLDDSGSMDRNYLPEGKQFDGRGQVGQYSSWCNTLYYDPTITYSPPIKADGTQFPDSQFTSAHVDGFRATSAMKDLNTLDLGYYYVYNGFETERNYDSTSTFFRECDTPINHGDLKFAKRRLSTVKSARIMFDVPSATSVAADITVNGESIMTGPASGSTSEQIAAAVASRIGKRGYSATSVSNVVTIFNNGAENTDDVLPVVISDSGAHKMTWTADPFADTDAFKLTNFANWYSYYRTRILVMKTAIGHSFSKLDDGYRVGLMEINNFAITKFVDTFSGSHRASWYDSLYRTSPSGDTPLREALSRAGRYFAGKAGGADPLLAACQKNYTILSTDGYWNERSGYIDLKGSLIGNEDSSSPRPYYDGGINSGETVTSTTYSRNFYSIVDCAGSSQKKLKTQPELGVCHTKSGGIETCNWAAEEPAIYGTCAAAISLPSPNPSARIQLGAPIVRSGPVPGSSGTLADVAQYYYQTNLRTPELRNCGVKGGLCQTGMVPPGAFDNNTNQHMNTFTFGLGVNGRMRYSSDYLTDFKGDYSAVALGKTANSANGICRWQADGTVCNWPTPGSTDTEKVDDLWHAAVNGRGRYFAASDPTSLANGLVDTLTQIASTKANSGTAATSTLSPVPGNNYAYLASYVSKQWSGNLQQHSIDTESGRIGSNANWCAESVVADLCLAPATMQSVTSGGVTTTYCVTPDTIPAMCANGVMDGLNCKVQMSTGCTGTMSSRVSAASDTRSIYTAGADASALVEFNEAFTLANPGYFDSATLSKLSQWARLTPAQQAKATGVALVRFIRGQYGNEDRDSNAFSDRLFRARSAVLGDIVDSPPVFLGPPSFSYPDPGYAGFAQKNARRKGVVYFGGNDGMLHAFEATTGRELWAYVPSMVIPDLWRLADKNYASSHANFVNGPVSIGDVCTANCANPTVAVWKTILVGGLNGGGRGYYALDITDSDRPELLWEFTTSGGNGSLKDDDLGYTFGQPVITKKANGEWVVLVTSGYNNVQAGLGGAGTSGNNGKGYLYVISAESGNLISKIATSAGSTATPSGLAKINVWNASKGGNFAGYVYGGDLMGNLWRFDVNDDVTPAQKGTGSVINFATLYSDESGTVPQAITTTPTLGEVKGKRVVFVATGKYLETDDLTSTQVQTQYAITDEDDGATLVNPRTKLVQQVLTNGTDGKRLITDQPFDLSTERGWFFDFPDSGERANVDSKLAYGTLIIPTTVPTSNACQPGGYGYVNYVNYATGGAVVPGDSLAGFRTNSSVSGLVMIFINGRPTTSVITKDQVLKPDIPFRSFSAGFNGKRVNWRQLVR